MKLSYIIFILLSVALIFPLGFPAWAGEIEELRQQLEKKEKEIQKLQEQTKEYEESLIGKKKEAHTLEDTIIGFNRQIHKLQTEIEINEKQVSSLGLQIIKTEIQIQAQEDAILRNKEHIAALIREIHASSNEDLLELLLKYENISDFYNQVQYRGALQYSLDNKLENLKLFKQTLEDEKENLEIEKEKLKDLKRDLAARKQIIEDQRVVRRDLLRQTRNEEGRYQELLKATEEREREVLLQVYEIEDQLRRTIDRSLLPQAIPGVISWPTEGILTQGYGCIENRFARRIYPSCNDGSGGFHNGLDIAAALGTSIRVARNGIVIAVENSPYAYGKWIAVEHDNDLITVYAHMSLQSVNKGQEVKRGEVIGYMGSTGFSTGSHLHFTLYAPGTFTTKLSKIAGILPIGATLNPLDYLP